MNTISYKSVLPLKLKNQAFEIIKYPIPAYKSPAALSRKIKILEFFTAKKHKKRGEVKANRNNLCEGKSQ